MEKTNYGDKMEKTNYGEMTLGEVVELFSNEEYFHLNMSQLHPATLAMVIESLAIHVNNKDKYFMLMDNIKPKRLLTKFKEAVNECLSEKHYLIKTPKDKEVRYSVTPLEVSKMTIGLNQIEVDKVLSHLGTKAPQNLSDVRDLNVIKNNLTQIDNLDYYIIKFNEVELKTSKNTTDDAFTITEIGDSNFDKINTDNETISYEDLRKQYAVLQNMFDMNHSMRSDRPNIPYTSYQDNGRFNHMFNGFRYPKFDRMSQPFVSPYQSPKIISGSRYNYRTSDSEIVLSNVTSVYYVSYKGVVIILAPIDNIVYTLSVDNMAQSMRREKRINIVRNENIYYVEGKFKYQNSKISQMDQDLLMVTSTTVTDLYSKLLVVDKINNHVLTDYQDSLIRYGCGDIIIDAFIKIINASKEVSFQNGDDKYHPMFNRRSRF